MAPDARIVSVKVGVADGSVDVSQVIAAIDWVVQHRNDNGLNIRVLNLSYGTDSTQPYTVDPLAFAVEQAWKRASSWSPPAATRVTCFKTGTLTNPAFDPLYHRSRRRRLDGDREDARRHDPGLLLRTGSNARYVDLVAPGSSHRSLRVPDSYIDRRI